MTGALRVGWTELSHEKPVLLNEGGTAVVVVPLVQLRGGGGGQGPRNLRAVKSSLIHVSHEKSEIVCQEDLLCRSLCVRNGTAVGF